MTKDKLLVELAGAIGLEVGNIGGQALANDIRFIIGKEPHPVYKTGKILPKYVDVNPYNGKKTQERKVQVNNYDKR